MKYSKKGSKIMLQKKTRTNRHRKHQQNLRLPAKAPIKAFSGSFKSLLACMIEESKRIS